MRTGRLGAAILCVAGLLQSQIPGQTTTPDPAGVLNRFAVARFLGSGNQSIQAMTSDPAGNVYVAGTTSSPDFPVRNPWQPLIGEAVLMRSTDVGVTWGKVSFPTSSLVTLTPHPSDPQTLFAGAVDGIYKSGDGGMAWRKVDAWVNSANVDQIYIAADPAYPQNVYFYAAVGGSQRLGHTRARLEPLTGSRQYLDGDEFAVPGCDYRVHLHCGGSRSRRLDLRPRRRWRQPLSKQGLGQHLDEATKPHNAARPHRAFQFLSRSPDRSSV